MKLTTNFSKSEFDCKCGCQMPLEVFENVKILARQLQLLRDQTKESIKVNSGYRCDIHNRTIGGSKNSQHLLGKASDIVIKNQTPKEVFNLIENNIKLGLIWQGGLGSYNTFTHYDIRGNKARW